jgi:hypothetical protein
MIFRRTDVFGRAGLPRPQPRRGTFALEPVDALPRLSERVSALAERALESNPFFLPEFLEPAIQAFGRKGLKLATFSDREDLRFFAPVVASGGRLFTAPKLKIWTHPYAPLGAPLIEREMAPQVADSVIKNLRTTGRSLLSIPDLPLKGPAAHCMQKAAERWGFWTEAARQMRPILNPSYGGGAADFDQMVTQKRRRELDRQLRRLCDTGSVSFMSAHTPSEIETAFNMFIALEASGWKGRRGTALQRRRSILEFARVAVMQLAQSGHASIDVVRVGDKPVAALIRFHHGGLSIPWKIAHDETFANFSPGRQLICDETRRWLSDPTVSRVDPVCEEGNTLFTGLWPDREPYGTLLVSTRRLAVGARLRAALINVRSSAKKAVKSLTRRPNRSAKPVPKREKSEKPGAQRRDHRR